ncbi:M48 family metallopeptidase [Desulfobulbus alkaliphilus]|uniref:M48 family metallopeptidase n=1 Tax=Desulfobulbus alkaliphilus TaxID=869814 RepID=UPI00196266DD|nr:M48 family metallopeptidase [Desulfobulbus alkaliphilus]MBM9537313.1 M48 family metalloprotease [Desulfobulbus alkaliphilus]
MLYNNLIYFLVVIFLFSVNMPPETPLLAPYLALPGLVGSLWAFNRLARWVFATAGPGPAAYFSAERKLSVLAVLIFIVFVHLFDLKYYLAPLDLGGRLPILTNVAGLVCFFGLLALIWRHARPRYQAMFGRLHSSWSFIRSNIRANLPIVLPWLFLSLLFDLLILLPITVLEELLHSPWGELGFFVLFLVFLVLAFPPLVRWLWDCRPLPPGPQRDRIVRFCRAQGFRSEILIWPLFEGQVLTAGIMGIVPRLRYLLITPALLEALSDEEIDSVLAHEIGHVKRLHLVLYILMFLGFSLLAGSLAEPLPHVLLASDFFYRLLTISPFAPENLMGILITVPLLVLMVLYFRYIFGYFIRNFERQADLYVFKVQGTSWPLIASFEKIARLSGSRREEKNWHHFGLGERIDFLQRCERDRTLIKKHDRKLLLSLAVYVLVIITLVTTLQRMDAESISHGYETRYAEAVLLRKVRQEPENSFWLIVLGDLLQSRQMEKKAMEAYEQALLLTPMNADLNNNLAWLLLTAQDRNLRDRERALTLARTASLLKEHGYVLDTLATAYWANGLLAEALATQEMAIRIDPENRGYYLEQMEKFRQVQWEDDLNP